MTYHDKKRYPLSLPEKKKPCLRFRQVAKRAGVKIATACNSGICGTCMTDLEDKNGKSYRPGFQVVRACVTPVSLLFSICFYDVKYVCQGLNEAPAFVGSQDLSSICVYQVYMLPVCVVFCLLMVVFFVFQVKTCTAVAFSYF